MRPAIRFPLGIGLVLAAVLMFLFAEHEAVRTGFYIITFYVAALALLIAGLLTLANVLHKIVPDDWTPGQ